MRFHCEFRSMLSSELIHQFRHGQMSQQKRLGALGRFKSKSRSVLVCTDVAARGLDIPHVDCVINYDV